MNIQALLSERVRQAMTAAGAPADYEPQVRQSTKVQFGDHQANGMTVVAEKLGMVSRQLAEQMLTHLDFNDIVSKVEIVGPGFINIFLDLAFLAEHVQQVLAFDHLGVSTPEKQTTVVDYSMPNVAREMHVGHLRSIIIGDTAMRTLEFLGHKVTRTNHVGDWNIRFGMLIVRLEKQQQENVGEVELADPEDFYRDVKKHYDEDEEFAEYTHSYMIKLQSGGEHFRKMWRELVDTTIMQSQIICDRLNMTLTRDDVMGESLYNPMLPGIVTDLKAKGLAVESGGATVIFLDEFRDKEGEPMSVVTQEKDGGHLYIATNVACARYRYETLYADRMLYYIGFRQHQHPIQAWAIVRKAGYVLESVPLEHHMSGVMLGRDGRSFKTRTGGTVELADLLDETLERARHLMAGKNPDMLASEPEKLANVVGIGVVKHVDLSKNRTTDCIFDRDNILAFEGNTVSYMQYAYTRVLSMLREAKISKEQLAAALVIIREDRETQLATRLLQSEETLTVVAHEGTPHATYTYLHDLAGLFPGFYGHCLVLSVENEEVRNSRPELARLTARTLEPGLDTLGIETVKRTQSVFRESKA